VIGRWHLVRAVGLLCDWFPESPRGVTGTVWLAEANGGVRRAFRTQTAARLYCRQAEGLA
jgi:hypothetical protein